MAIQKPLVIIGGQVQQLPSGDSIPVAYNGGTDPIMSSFAGPVVTSTGTYRYYHPTATNITGVYISLGTASSSGSVVIDVKKNGTSIFSGTYPTITATNYLSSLVSITSAITASDYLTIDVTSAGTGAADLNVYIVVEADTTGLTQVDFIDFDTTANHAVLEGEVAWNAGEGTLDVGLAGGNVTLSVGQENVALCYNGSGSNMTDGQVVYITGAQGQRPDVRLAQANSEATSSKTFGIVTEPITAGSEGYVTTFGVLRGIDTSAFSEGAALWLSPTVAGGMTATKPAAPNHLVLVGWCVKSHATSGEVFVHTQNGYELDELHDVLITSPTTGDTITWDGSKWVNAPVVSSSVVEPVVVAGFNSDVLYDTNTHLVPMFVTTSDGDIVMNGA